MKYDARLNKGNHRFEAVKVILHPLGDHTVYQCACGLVGRSYKTHLNFIEFPQNVDLKKLIQCPKNEKLKPKIKLA